MFFGAHRIPFEAFNGRGFARCATFLWNHDPALTVASALGVLTLLARAARRLAARAPERPAIGSDWIVVLSFALPTALMLGAYGRTQGRFLTPLIPILALFGAAGVSALVAVLARVSGRVLARSVVVPAALSVPVWTGVLLLGVQQRPDTLELAGAWVRANVDREREVVASDRFCTLPVLSYGFTRDLSFDAAGVWGADSFWFHLRTGVFSTWDLYQARLDPMVLLERGYQVRNLFVNPGDFTPPQYHRRVRQRLKSAEPDYVLVSIPGKARASVDPTRSIMRESEARLVARFPPGAPEEPAEDLFHYDMRAALPTLRRATGLGKTLELYRLTPR